MQKYVQIISLSESTSIPSSTAWASSRAEGLLPVFYIRLKVKFGKKISVLTLSFLLTFAPCRCDWRGLRGSFPHKHVCLQGKLRPVQGPCLSPTASGCGSVLALPPSLEWGALVLSGPQRVTTLSSQLWILHLCLQMALPSASAQSFDALKTVFLYLGLIFYFFASQDQVFICRSLIFSCTERAVLIWIFLHVPMFRWVKDSIGQKEGPFSWRVGISWAKFKQFFSQFSANSNFLFEQFLPHCWLNLQTSGPFLRSHVERLNVALCSVRRPQDKAPSSWGQKGVLQAVPFKALMEHWIWDMSWVRESWEHVHLGFVGFCSSYLPPCFPVFFMHMDAVGQVMFRKVYGGILCTVVCPVVLWLVTWEIGWTFYLFFLFPIKCSLPHPPPPPWGKTYRYVWAFLPGRNCDWFLLEGNSGGSSCGNFTSLSFGVEFLPSERSQSLPRPVWMGALTLTASFPSEESHAVSGLAGEGGRVECGTVPLSSTCPCPEAMDSSLSRDICNAVHILLCAQGWAPWEVSHLGDHICLVQFHVCTVYLVLGSVCCCKRSRKRMS